MDPKETLTPRKWEFNTKDRGWWFYIRGERSITFTFLSGGSGAAFAPNNRKGSAIVTEHAWDGPVVRESIQQFKYRADADKWARAVARKWRASYRDHGHTHDLDDAGRCRACGEYVR